MEITTTGDLAVETPQRCDLCSRPGNAMWFGPEGTITICHQCALHALPRLMADGLALPSSWSTAKSFMLQINGIFWETMVCRMIREKSQTQRIA